MQSAMASAQFWPLCAAMAAIKTATWLLAGCVWISVQVVPVHLKFNELMPLQSSCQHILWMCVGGLLNYQNLQQYEPQPKLNQTRTEPKRTDAK